MIARAYVHILGGAALAAGAFAAGWTVNGWRLNTSALHDALARSEASAESARLAIAARDQLADQLRTSGDRHAVELGKAKDENDRLRADVDAGPVVLRVAAKCPAAVPVPGSASAPGVDPGPRPELDPAARPAYFALRGGIDTVQSQLRACQSELMLRTGQQ